MTNQPRQKPKSQKSGEQKSGEQSEAPKGNGVDIDNETREHLGRMLKATYDEVAHEPVPQKFLDLLDQLEKSEQRKQ